MNVHCPLQINSQKRYRKSASHQSVDVIILAAQFLCRCGVTHFFESYLHLSEKQASYSKGALFQMLLTLLSELLLW